MKIIAPYWQIRSVLNPAISGKGRNAILDNTILLKALSYQHFMFQIKAIH